nr:Asp23/Gls24 family envelope stress response protein [Arthrobacter sp. L77]
MASREHRQDAPTPTSSAADRGTLTMSEKVIEKLAAQSAYELSFVAGLGGGVLGVGRKADTDHRPQVDVELSGRNVTVFLDIALDFPTDIAARSAQIRRHVSGSIETATGLQVRRIDITVKALTTTTDRPRRSLQ